MCLKGLSAEILKSDMVVFGLTDFFLLWGVSCRLLALPTRITGF